MDDAPTIEQLRTQVTATLENLRNYQQGITAPVIQELVLAQRHLEDARMRLGVALAYEKGLDPWTNKVEEK